MVPFGKLLNKCLYIFTLKPTFDNLLKYLRFLILMPGGLINVLTSAIADTIYLFIFSTFLILKSHKHWRNDVE